MDTEIFFLIKGNDGALLSEADIEWYLSEMHNLDNLTGYVVVSNSMNTVELTDDLDYLIPNLCLLSVPALVDDGSFCIIRASASGNYELQATKEQVLVYGTGIKKAVFQKQSFLRASLECGARFLEFLRKLDAGTGSYQGTIDELENAQLIARSFMK